MSRKCFCLKPILHFSRWNRKGYAIFASLGKEVRIATLAIEICKVALEKSSMKGIIVNLSNVFTEFSEEPKEQDEDLEEQVYKVIPLFSAVDLPAGSLNFKFNVKGISCYNK